jgi:hypothetical protein
VCFAVGGPTNRRQILKNVSHGLFGPGTPSRYRQLARLLESPTDFIQPTAIAPNPRQDSLDESCLLSIRLDTLSRCQISIVDEESAVSKAGMEMFGGLDLATCFEEGKFAISVKNGNHKRFRSACTVGLRVFLCHKPCVSGKFQPQL